MEFTTDQIVKVVLAVITLIGIICGAIFAVNKRNHKIGNVNGSNNNVINGDITHNSNNKNRLSND